MAVTTTSPNRQTVNIEVMSTVDDQWRIVDDHDWPSQLVSSINYGTDADPHVHGEHDQRPHMDGGNNIKDSLATTHHQSSQPAPMKMLTRPLSAHKDPAAGFSFSKAERAKTFDFRLKQHQNPAIRFDSHPSLAEQSTTGKSPPGLPAVAADVPDTAQNMAKAAVKRTPSPKDATASVTGFGVPFPNAEHVQSRVRELESAEISAAQVAQVTQDVASPATLTNDISMSRDDTLVEQPISDMNAANDQHIANTLYSNARQQPTLFEDSLHDTPKSNYHRVSQDNQRRYNPKSSRAPQTTPLASTRITKSRRKRHVAGPNVNGNPCATMQFIPYGEEDLLAYFTLKHKQGLHDRQLLEAAHNAKVVELRNLRDVSSGLFNQVQTMEHQFQDLEQRHNETEKRLSKMNAAKPGWESKVKRLSDFLKGLSNDHNRLRDNSKDLRERQLSVLEEKESLTEALREVRTKTEDQHVKSKHLVTEARHELKLLGQTIQNQQSELRSKQTLILTEQERSSRLEEQIHKFADGHGQLERNLSDHRTTITSKIDELLSKAANFQATIPLESQEYLRPMMEQCVEMLRDLQGSDTIKPDDLDALKVCLRGYFDGITRSIDACEHSATMTEAGHQHLTISMTSQLQALGDNIVTEHTLSEQVMDLREMKATLRERVSATDNSLVDARLQIANLLHKEQEQTLKISTLEGSLAKAHPPLDESLTLLRFQELDTRNRDLENELTSSRAEAGSLAKQAEKTSNDLEDLQARMGNTQSQLEEALRETEIVREEKASCEQRATQQLEQLRKDMTNSANQELANLRKEKAKKTPLDDRLSHVTKQFIIIKAEKEKIEQETIQLKESLDGMVKERQREARYQAPPTAFAERLRSRVTELESQVVAQDAVLVEVRGDLNAANADMESKDGYITILQGSLTQARSETEQDAEKLRDQQTRHRERTSAIIEDSQPATSGVVVPADLLSDPFMGNEYPGSQQAQSQQRNVSEADLQSLFADTPLAQKKTLNVDPRLSTSRGSVASPRLSDPRKDQRKFLSRQGHTETESKGNNPNRQSTGPPQKIQRPPNNNMPRGILKDPRGEKRPAAGSATSSMAVPKRRKSSLAGLGPVIADSQSPDRLLLGKGRKQSTKGKKTAKDEEMNRRFSQELR